MKPEVCKNCCATEFTEQEDDYVCAYCGSRFHKAPVQVVREIHYVEVPVQKPAQEPTPTGQRKNKWLAFFLCLYLGFFGAHKFYEGRTGQGILYLLTMGLFGIGWFADIFILLFKPNPYYVP